MQTDFLPITLAEVKERGWDQPDFVFVSGDAYVDHPAFGAAILTRVLTVAGYHVAVLAQPNWRTLADFRRFGRPKHGFFVSGGVVDSMVNHYTAAKKTRSEDAYSPGGKRGQRPDRAVTVYSQRIREAYPNIPIALGGVEASLRRFAHYDYWDDAVRRSVLMDSGATCLCFGMGEEVILQIARAFAKNEPLQGIRGIAYVADDKPADAIEMASFEEVAEDPRAYAQAFQTQYEEQDPVRGKMLAQAHGQQWVVQNRPAMPLSRSALDRVYALPFTRLAHPCYDAVGGVPALEEVRFSIAATRGCFGACNFCSLTMHQGRIVTSRSPSSIVREAEMLTHDPDFKGYIHDVGGPTANFRKPPCAKQMKQGACKHRQCLAPTPCPHARADHKELLEILTDIRTLPGVKKVFIRSGLRFDYILMDKSTPFLRELLTHHVSGRLKVAPEHVVDSVLERMGKPGHAVYERFVQAFDALDGALGGRQQLQPYLMSSHPGCDLLASVTLAETLRKMGQQPESIQDFYPTPGTPSTTMFHTGLDPKTLRPVYTAKTPHEKALQRALLQVSRPESRSLVREALTVAGRDDLIGFHKGALVPPPRENPAPVAKPKPQKAATPAKPRRAGLVNPRKALGTPPKK